VAAAEGAARLTRQLLTFAHREPVRALPLDLNEIVTDTQALLARSIGEDIALVVRIEELVPIRADRGQTEQVLLNLVANARDAMPSGGTLTIETATAELDDGYVRLNPDVEPGRYVCLSVSDTGCGMTPEVAARAFEPFFTTKSNGIGSGFGLATVYGIVVALGGSVNLDSEPGVGTTTRVYFPAAPDARPAQDPPPISLRTQGHGETILVVEDQPAVRAVTAAMLERNGYVVIAAAGAAHAMSLASVHPFSLLLTDVVMPEMSGRALAEEIRSSYPASNILYMSGYSEGVLEPGGPLDAGIQLIHKPFNEKDLLTAVSAAISATPNEATR
jgi:CheY-like chemotaxis protein